MTNSFSLFFRLIISLLFFTIPSACLGNQIIYLLNNTDHDGFQLTKKLLVNQNPERREAIIKNLINSGRLLEATPERIKRNFDFTLFDHQENIPSNQLIIQKLPRVVIANTGEETGFGLLALDTIEKGNRIAKYTGEVITNEEVFNNLPNQIYVADASLNNYVFRKIDARRMGSSARFAAHLPTYDELLHYNFTGGLLSEHIATANSELNIDKNGSLWLVATRKINPLELIGFDYGSAYIWQKEPLLFDTEGNTISPNLYTRYRRDLIITDQDQLSTPNNLVKYFIYNLTNQDLMGYIKKHNKDDGTIFYGDHNSAYLINTNELIEAINQPTRHIRVTGKPISKLNKPKQLYF